MLKFLRLNFLSLFLFFLSISVVAQKHEWARAIKSVDSSNSFIHPFHINADANGNTITSGLFAGKFDFGSKTLPFKNPSGYLYTFINKLDSNGSVKWNRTLNGETYAFGGTVDNSNNVYISGYTNDTLFIDSTHFLESKYGGSNFCLKFSEKGDFIWGNSIESHVQSTYTHIITDNKNCVYMSGFVFASHKDSVDMNPSDSAVHNIYVNRSTFYLLKLDSNGIFQWVKTFNFPFWAFGINQFDQLYFQTPFNNTLLVQLKNGTDTLISKNGTSDIAFGQINTNNGETQWVKTLQSKQHISNTQINTKLPTDKNGNAFLFGTFSKSINHSDSPQNEYKASKGNRNFICKIDSSGNLLWLNYWGGKDRDYIRSITIDNAENVYVGTNLNAISNFETKNGKISVYSPPNKRVNLIKFDSSGYFKWAKPIDTKGSALVEGIAWSNGSIYSSGTYTKELIAKDTLMSNNSNSLFTVKTNSNGCNRIPFYDSLYLCTGDSSFIPNVQITDSGNYIQRIEDKSGCDSLRHIFLKVKPSYSDSTTLSFCKGDSIFYKSQFYKKQTTFIYPNSTVLGCDSSKVVILKMDSIPTTKLKAAICEGDTFYFNNSSYFKSGLYMDTLKANNGCDSITSVNLTVRPIAQKIQSKFICDGETFRIGNSAYTKSGNYVDTLKNDYACDSIVHTQLTVIKTKDSTINDTICKGDSITINNIKYSRKGSYIQSKFTKHCRYTIFINIEELPTYKSFQQFALCLNDSVKVGNEVHTKSGVYLQNFQATDGCDSIVETKISIPKFTTEISQNSLSIVDNDSLGKAQFLWYNCDSERILPNETDRHLFYKRSGNYAPIIILENCRDTLGCTSVIFNDKYKLHIFPNPTKDYCIITVPTKGKIKIYNDRSSLVKKEDFNYAGEHKIALPKLAASIYFVVFEGEKGPLTEKLLITK